MDIRGVMSGAMLRSIAGIKDAGEVTPAHVGDVDGGEAVDVEKNGADVWVKLKQDIEEKNQRPITARLFFAGNILFAFPIDDDSVTVLRPQDADGPGVPVALHGDGGADGTVPSWLDKSNAGISFANIVHIESRGDQVVIKSNAGTPAVSATITLNKDGSIDITPATGKAVNVGGAAHPLPLWDSYEAALKTWVTAMQTMINAIVPGTGIATPAQTTAATACGTLLALLTGTFDSQVAKNG